MKLFKNVSVVTSVITFSIFASLMFYPQAVYTLFSIDGGPSADFMGRRGAMLFLGMSVYTWVGRNAPHSESRQALCLGLAVSIFALSIHGTTEFLRGFAGAGILLTVATEIFLGFSFAKVWLESKNLEV